MIHIIQNIYHYNHKLLYILCFPPITWLEISPFPLHLDHHKVELYKSNTSPANWTSNQIGAPAVGALATLIFSRLVCWKWGREVRYDDWEMFSKICIYMI